MSLAGLEMAGWLFVRRARGEDALQPVELGRGRADVHEIAVLQDRVGVRHHAFAEPGEEGDPRRGQPFDRRDATTDPGRRHGDLGEDHLAAGVGERRHRAGRQQAVDDLIGRPCLLYTSRCV